MEEFVTALPGQVAACKQELEILEERLANASKSAREIARERKDLSEKQKEAEVELQDLLRDIADLDLQHSELVAINSWEKPLPSQPSETCKSREAARKEKTQQATDFIATCQTFCASFSAAEQEKQGGELEAAEVAAQRELQEANHELAEQRTLQDRLEQDLEKCRLEISKLENLCTEARSVLQQEMGRKASLENKLRAAEASSNRLSQLREELIGINISKQECEACIQAHKREQLRLETEVQKRQPLIKDQEAQLEQTRRALSALVGTQSNEPQGFDYFPSTCPASVSQMNPTNGETIERAYQDVPSASSEPEAVDVNPRPRQPSQGGTVLTETIITKTAPARNPQGWHEQERITIHEVAHVQKRPRFEQQAQQPAAAIAHLPARTMEPAQASLRPSIKNFSSAHRTGQPPSGQAWQPGAHGLQGTAPFRDSFSAQTRAVRATPMSVTQTLCPVPPPGAPVPEQGRMPVSSTAGIPSINPAPPFPLNSGQHEDTTACPVPGRSSPAQVRPQMNTSALAPAHANKFNSGPSLKQPLTNLPGGPVRQPDPPQYPGAGPPTASMRQGGPPSGSPRRQSVRQHPQQWTTAPSVSATLARDSARSPRAAGGAPPHRLGSAWGMPPQPPTRGRVPTRPTIPLSSTMLQSTLPFKSTAPAAEASAAPKGRGHAPAAPQSFGMGTSFGRGPQYQPPRYGAATDDPPKKVARGRKRSGAQKATTTGRGRGRQTAKTRPQRVYTDDEVSIFETDEQRERRLQEEKQEKEDAELLGDIWGGRSHA